MTSRIAEKLRSGFTIIELAVVIVLITLLTSVAVLKLRGPYQRAQFFSTIERLEQLDRLARTRARQQQRPGLIKIDLKQGKLQAFEHGRASKALSQVSLGSHHRIDRVISHGRTARSGVARIHVGPQGQTPSYALRVKKPHDEQIWLLFAARTGQMIELESDREVGNLLLSEATTGLNSD